MNRLVEGPDGPVELLVTGEGQPSTVFVHGLASSIAETRPFGSGVAGTRAFLHLRGHGASAAPESPWTYDALAAEMRAVADEVGATRGLGVSLGAGALVNLAAAEPDRFDTLVLVLPGVLDRPRADGSLAHLRAMAAHVDDRDVEGLAALLREEQPAEVRDLPAVRVWCRRRASLLVGTPVSRALRELPEQTAVDDASRLAGVRARVLVIAQEGDPTHPVDVAEATAAAFTDSRLVVLPPGGVLWRHRPRVRELVTSVLR